MKKNSFFLQLEETHSCHPPGTVSLYTISRAFFDQCDQIWQNFATLAKIYKSVIFLTLYFLFGNILSLLWQICYIIGQIFIAANGQML